MCELRYVALRFAFALCAVRLSCCVVCVLGRYVLFGFVLCVFVGVVTYILTK